MKEKICEPYESRGQIKVLKASKNQWQSFISDDVKLCPHLEYGTKFKVN